MADELDARMRSLSAHTGAAFEAGSVGRPRGEEPPLGHPLPAPLGIDGDERRDPAGRERNRAGGGGGEAGGGAEGVAQASGSAARALPAQPEQERQQARVVVSGAPADDVSRDRHKKAWKMVLADQQGQPPFDYKHAGLTIQLQVTVLLRSLYGYGCPSEVERVRVRFSTPHRPLVYHPVQLADRRPQKVS